MSALFRATAGWVAALQLTVLALRASEDPVLAILVLPSNRRMAAAVARDTRLPEVHEIQKHWDATTPFRVLILAVATGLAVAAALQ